MGDKPGVQAELHPTGYASRQLFATLTCLRGASRRVSAVQAFAVNLGGDGVVFRASALIH